MLTENVRVNVIIAGELKITQINLVTEFGKVPDEFSWPQMFIKFPSHRKRRLLSQDTLK